MASRPFVLSEVERETLRELTVNHPYGDIRRRGLGLLQRDTLKDPKRVAAPLGVTFQRVYNGRKAWDRAGVCGRLGGHEGGREAALRPEHVQTLTALARREALYRRAFAQRLHERHPDAPQVHPQTLARTLKAQGFTFRRVRWSLKKSATSPSSNTPAPYSPILPAPAAPVGCD